MAQKKASLKEDIETEVLSDVHEHIEALFVEMNSLAPLSKINLLDPQEAAKHVEELKIVQERIAALQKTANALRKFVTYQ